jgi:hypothetical protein
MHGIRPFCAQSEIARVVTEQTSAMVVAVTRGRKSSEVSDGISMRETKSGTPVQTQARMALAGSTFDELGNFDEERLAGKVAVHGSS